VVQSYTHTPRHRDTHTHKYTNTNTYTPTNTRIRTHTLPHTHTHIHIHTRTHDGFSEHTCVMVWRYLPDEIEGGAKREKVRERREG